MLHRNIYTAQEITYQRANQVYEHFIGLIGEDGDADNADAIWAYITETWPDANTESAQKVEAAYIRLREARVAEMARVIVGYYAVRDTPCELIRFIRGLSAAQAEHLHDFLSVRLGT